MMINDAEVLPLFPWEERSIVQRTCAPPTISNHQNLTTTKTSGNTSVGIDFQPFPAKCCIGSSSAGGQVTFQPQICNLGLEPYERAARHAGHFLNNSPIIQQKSSKSATTLCDVCRIVEQLARRNWTMSFQGDSTMNQMVDALDCELRRRGYTVDSEMKSWRRQEGLFWRRGIGAVHRIRVWPPIVAAGTSGPPVVLRFYIMYRPLEKNSSEIHHIMERSDVLVFDHGVHYTFEQRADFLSEMTDLLGTLLRKTNKNSTSDIGGGDHVSPTTAATRPKLVAWRETVSQHFDTPTGDFSHSVKGLEDCVQHPYLRNTTAHPPGKLSWYQEYMMRAAHELDLDVVNAGNATVSNFIGSRPSLHSSLVVLPFTQFTRPMHYLHPGKSDCTHICYSPFTWMPVWRALRRAIDAVALEHATCSSHPAKSHVSNARIVLSEWAILAGVKLDVHYLGLFICGALLLCRTFNNIENKTRCGGKPIVLALCTALLIEIAGVANMRGILQLFCLDI